MVVPNGVAAARSGSTWMNWWSWVMSANWSIWSWVTSNHSPVPSSLPMSALNRSNALAAASLMDPHPTTPIRGGCQTAARRMEIPFTHNPYPTVGVELELHVVDRATGDLANAAVEILEELGRDHPDGEHPKAKHELFQ